MAAVTVSEVYDAVLTTTLRNMAATLRDNITYGSKYARYLQAHGRIKSWTGGERIKVPLMYGLNSTADIYSGYGIITTTPQDGITSAFYPLSQMAVSISISGQEERQNRGRHALISLFGSKTEQAQASGIQLMNNCLVMGRLSSGASGSVNQFVARVGKTDNSADGPLPLPALIDANATRSVAIGSINGANEPYWRNQTRTFSGTTFQSYKNNKGRIYNDCSKGIFGHPDLILSDQLVWELYFNSLNSQERYIVDRQRAIDVLGGPDDEGLMFRGAVHIWDEVVPDVGASTATNETETGLGDGVGTYLQSGAHGTEYHLNSQALELHVDDGRNWEPTPFVKPGNGDFRVGQLLWMGQHVVNNRRKLGVMRDIDNSIAS